MDFKLEIPDGDNQRGAFRTRIPGLKAKLQETGVSFDVKDLSATGIALLATVESRLKEGATVTADLMIAGKPVLIGLKSKIVRRINQDILACQFVELDRRQEARLDKLVLEFQKRMIAQRKAKQQSKSEDKLG